MIKLLTVLSHFVGIFQSWPKNLMISCLFKYILTIVPMLWEGIILARKSYTDLKKYFLEYRNILKGNFENSKDWQYAN